ncbi:hypothetical protein EEB14_54140 [Rhodococcus sp. WS4]|nr:hypothetical protein EEB14_54140 [Rhodococcus sp. WS4]
MSSTFPTSESLAWIRDSSLARAIADNPIGGIPNFRPTWMNSIDASTLDELARRAGAGEPKAALARRVRDQPADGVGVPACVPAGSARDFRCRRWPQTESEDPHIITAAAHTGTDIELRIHAALTPFDVPPWTVPWAPGAETASAMTELVSGHRKMSVGNAAPRGDS